MKTAITILAVFFVIGILVSVGALFFGARSFSSSLPKGGGGIITFDGKEFKQIKSTAGFEVKDIVFSHANKNAVYLATLSNGIWVSKNGGEIFTKAQDKVLQGKVDVYDIEENSKGDLYSSIYNFKDNRGSLIFSKYPPENSTEIYFSSLPRFGIFGSSVVNGTISIISSDGGFYRSINNGKSWELRSRGSVGFLKMKYFSGKFWVLTSEGRILSTSDYGKNFKDITPKSDSFGVGVSDFYLNPRNGFLIAVSEKIFLSKNGGESWSALNLIVSPDTLPIVSAVVHPNDSNIIFAASERIIYKSSDGGNSWSFFELLMNGQIYKLFVDSLKPNLLFIGTK